MPSENAAPSPSAKPTFSVLVSSCDSYSDLWPFFFHFFNLQWPQPSVPVRLLDVQRLYSIGWKAKAPSAAAYQWYREHVPGARDS
ncbi:MAG: hypothetical protein IPK32_12135 [Verrucomicrobiaceae bacterium]|nr:hypothetical protein [Verrucomicrobiaceae bacterium]